MVAITDSTLAPLYPLASAALLVRSDMISFVDSITAPLSLLNAPDRHGGSAEKRRGAGDLLRAGAGLVTIQCVRENGR